MAKPGKTPPLKVERMVAFIKKLTTSEKRYFRRQARTAQSKHNYLEVFDYLDKTPGVTEQTFAEHFAGRDFIRNPASAFHYLTKLIRNALVEFYASSVDSFSLNQELQGAKALLVRGFVQESEKLLRSIAKRAEVSEDPFLLPQALFWQRKALIKNQRSKFPLAEIRRNIRKSRAAMRQLQLTIQWESRFFQLADVLYERGLEGNSKPIEFLFDWITNHSQEIKGNFEGNMYRLNMESRIFREKGDWAKSHQARKELVEWMESRSQWIKLFGDQYSIALSNLTLSSNATGDEPTLLDALEKMKRIEVIDPEQGVVIRLKALMADINRLIEKGRFAQCQALVVEAEPFFENGRTQLAKANEITFLYYFAYAFYGNRQYKEALKWINRIQEETLPPNNLSIHIMAHLLRLLIYFETENASSVLRFGPKTLEFFQKNKAISKVEQFFLTYFLQWAEMFEEKGPQAYDRIKELDVQFEKLKSRKGMPAHHDLFHFGAWLIAQRKKCTYEEAFKIAMEKG